MKFKKLSLLGFKSFANKLDIKFGEGITAIVGPNGCGKSNVADAVRWVLGEQSAKLLRGANMQDVIFNGTQKRSALSYAEVSLTFDNKNRALFPSYDYEEIMITRKLYRSGESAYFLNGNPCLLRDISEMIRDAGFAREGYTIIGQGRVTELINSKPEDRRAIFEEAAGISKYKHKKLEAERKNERTRANLERIKDMVDEYANRLGPITRAAEKAQTSKTLNEQLKHAEINAYIYSYDNAAGKKAELSGIIDGFDAQIKAKQDEYERLSAEHAKAVDDAQSVETNLDEYRRELMALSVDKEKISGQIDLLTQQIDNINSQNASLISANEMLSDNYNELVTSADAKQRELGQKTELLKTLSEEFDKISAEYAVIADKVSEIERKLEADRRALMDAMARKADVNRNMGELTAERAALSDRAEIISERIENTAAGLDAAGETSGAISEKLQTLAKEKNELVAERDRVSAQNIKSTARLDEVNEEFVGLKSELAVDESRKKILLELQRSMEGYAVPVRRLLEDSKKDTRIASAILGVVGQVISVKNGFETAIEMALGSAMSNVVTRDENGAKLLVAYLKQMNYGRATFLPITSFKTRSIDPAYRHLLSREGCLGVATDVISYDPMFESIMSGLLGGTVIAANMDAAVELAKESKYSFRIVTVDGDILLPQGSITGGSKKSDLPSVFSHERELKELTEHVETTKRRMSELQAESSRLGAECASLSKRSKELIEDIHEYEVTSAALTSELTKLNDEISRLSQVKASDQAMLDSITARIAEISSDLELVEKTQDELSTDSRTEEDDRKHREYETMRAERDLLREKFTSANLQIVTLEKDVDTLKTEIARLKSEAIGTTQSIENNNMAILANNRAMQEHQDRLAELTTGDGGGGHGKRIAELNAKLSDLTSYKAELNNKAVDTENARLACNDEISRLTEAKHEQEILLTRVDSEMDALYQRVSDAYGLGYEECLPYKDENYDPEAGELQIAKLKRRISNLGAINENAIEEAQEIAKIYQEKLTQQDDLVKSLADEEHIIKEMSAAMLKDFDECFTKIRENFREIFTELFNGGTADLELTENPDPLLRGVEIKAQPPAKKLQSISLLSGGEKTLTAIAILFAILRLRPMPFCLLDEIEAALDDANVGRFASYLKKFSQDTQFIVITHRKPTMEQADCLYGVTMEEEGVTTVVSVRLSEAIKSAVSVTATD